MSKELFLSHSNSVPCGKFVLVETDIDIKTGEEVPNNKLNMIYASFDGSLADRLMAIGIAKNKCRDEKTVLLITNPETDVKF